MFSILILILFLFISIVLFVYPKMGLVMLFFLRPLVEVARTEENILWGFSLAEIIGIFIPTVLVIVIIVRSHRRIEIHPTIFLFLLFATISQGIQGTNDLAFYVRIVSSFPFLVFPQIVNWNDNDLLTFMRSIFWSVLFVFIAIYLSIGNEASVPFILEIRGELVSRWGGIFLVPTRTAYWITIFLVLGIFLFKVDHDSKYKYVYLLISILLCLPLYKTFSRTAWVSCALVILLWQILLKQYRSVAATGVLSLGLFLLPIGISDRLLAYDWGGTNRFILWRPALQLFVDFNFAEQLFGIGWSKLFSRLLQYLPFSYPTVGVGITENSLLFIILGGGLLAGLSFITYWIIVLRHSWLLGHYANSALKREFGLFAFVFVIMLMVQSLTDDLVLSPVMNWYYYVIIGIAMSIWRAHKSACASTLVTGLSKASNTLEEEKPILESKAQAHKKEYRLRFK